MAQSPFDLEAIRRNWARTIAPPKGRVPPRLSTVEVPRDVPAEVRQLVVRIRDLTLQRFPHREETLAPFFVELQRLADRLADSDGKSKENPAEHMSALLSELEDLLDAFAILKR
ncbi:MAG: hypothetical protein IPM54_37630 [Polyangiaceae bacterium]|nr:hypothetical protein [Polyangiaceae bacterium]